MKYLLYISLLFLASCSIEKKCHRLEKRIVKNARFCQMIMKDTITVKDTVYIGTVRKDSTFVMSNTIDTFYLNKDRLHVQIYKEVDTIRVFAQCDGDTIYIKKIVEVDKVQVSEMKVWLRSFGRFFRRWFWILIVIAIGVVIFKYGKKIPFIRNYLP